jgi:hypothetical protein
VDVFIGWSGERSLSLARLLYDWLPDVVQAVEPWLSEHDIEAGAQWTPELMTKLQAVRFAIMCVTAENRESSWLHFEAGLAAKAITTNRVCPVLLGITQADVTGPLTLFQMKEVAVRDDMLGLAVTINNNLQKPRTDAKVHVAFDAFWAKLQSGVNQIAPPTEIPAKRNPLEVAEETLLLLREQNKAIAEQNASLARIESKTRQAPVSFTPYKAFDITMDPQTLQDIMTYRFIAPDETVSPKDQILAPEARAKPKQRKS